MTLPTQGSISASQINVELGRASRAPLSLGGAVESGLGGISSGAISFSNFHGKSSLIREPATDEYYTGFDVDSGRTLWSYNPASSTTYIYWFSQSITKSSSVHEVKYLDFQGWRYHRGSFQENGGYGWKYYGIYRIKL